MRKIVSIIISTLMILSISISSFAQSTNILTLNDVINSAIESSKQLEIDDLNIKNSKKVYETAQDEADNIYIYNIENSKWHIANPDAAYVTSKRKEKELTPEQREYDIDFYRKSRDAHELEIKVEAYDIYYSLIKADKEIEYKSDYAKFMSDKLEVTKLKYEKGLISKNDYNLLELENQNADIELNLAQRDKKKYISKLYTLMGEGYHPHVKELEESLEYAELEISVEDALKKAFENRLEIFDADKNEEFKELEFEIVDRYYDDDEIEYSDAINSYEQSVLDAQTTKDDIEYEIRTSYNELLNSFDTIKINENEVIKNKILYFIAKLKYNLKMITKVELDGANIAYKKAEMDFDNSVIDYIVDKFEFEVAQDVGTGIVKGADSSMMMGF